MDLLRVGKRALRHNRARPGVDLEFPLLNEPTEFEVQWYRRHIVGPLVVLFDHFIVFKRSGLYR